MAIRRPTNYYANSDIIADLADMADSIEEELEEKVDKVEGKGLSINDYTTAEKQKLAGIEAQANKTVVDSSLNSSSTNPVQNKKVKEALDTKENTSNKVTTISSSSTNAQYPSAKLLYDQLAEKQEQIDALVEENSTMKKQQLKGQASGSSIQLTDSAEGMEIENVVIKGAMGQETRVGYNKIPYPYSDSTGKTSNGITFEVANGKISVNGTSTARNATFYLANNWNYVLSQAVTLCCTNLIDITKIQVAVSYYREGESNLTYTSFRNNPILLSSGSRIDTIYVQVSDSNVTVNETGIEIMMLEGDYTSSTIPEYEQYGATPSPEYESQVHGVTGTCNINLKNNDLTLQQNAPLSLGNIKLYDGDKIQISFINKAGYKKVTGASIVKTMQTSILWRIGVTQMFEDSTVFWSNSRDARQTSDKIVLCSHLSTVRDVYGQEKIGIEVHTGTGEIGVRVPNEIASTLDEFNSWISNNNVKFAYALAEPITTSITDPTLLSQLETLINMKTYKQITNIDTTGSDLAPVLEFQYSKDLQTVIDSINARLELVEN